MKRLLFLFFILLGFRNLSLAQSIKNLVTSKSELLEIQSLKSKAYLFIQEDCEACEVSIRQLAQCSQKIRFNMNLVILESEVWAKKKIESPEVKKINFASLNFMTREEAQKIKVRGTPTYLIGQIHELKPFSCQDIKKLLSDQQGSK